MRIVLSLSILLSSIYGAAQVCHLCDMSAPNASTLIQSPHCGGGDVFCHTHADCGESGAAALTHVHKTSVLDTGLTSQPIQLFRTNSDSPPCKTAASFELCGVSATAPLKFPPDPFSCRTFILRI